MKNKKSSDITILEETADKLVIEFGNRNIERTIRIIFYVLFTIGGIFCAFYLTRLIMNPTSFFMAAVFGMIIWLGLWWGIAGLVFHLAQFVSLLKGIIINRVNGTIQQVSFYPFRKEEKITSFPIKDVKKIYIHEVNNEGGSNCYLKALMVDGRQVKLCSSSYFEIIDQLDTIIKNFVGIPSIPSLFGAINV